MAFPREKSPAEDMRAIWAEFRRLRREMSAAHAAIDPGKSMEVRNGAGAPVAKVGHDGGSAGLLVPDGSGGWRTVQVDAQARADAALVAAEAQITTLSGRVSTAEGSISNHAGRIATLEGQTSGIGPIENRLTAVETGMGVVMSALQNLHNRVSALEGSSGPPPWA